ncbi:MAG TPA: NifU family protein [Cyclobacteriaceae bacterium]
MDNDNKRLTTIYLESNPNPNSLKFVANYMLLHEGENRDYPSIESTSNAPLAQQLFLFPYVRRVFYMSNFITVTKDEKVEWSDIQNELKKFITDYLSEGKPLLLHEENEKDDSSSASEIETKIKQILEEYVKPAVEQDGGAIAFNSFEDGKVKVLLQGSCSGCPSSTLTLKAGIENLLKRMVPEVQEVEAEGV